MKRTLKSVVAATIVLGTVVPSVFAANSSTDGAPTDISGNQFASAITTMINQGVMINYKGNVFGPTGPTSRGQAIAYLYNILDAQGVITQDYSGANPYHDEDINFKKQINDMYLFGYLDGLDFTDKSKHDVIGEGWTTPVTWLSALLCNVAGVSYDNTKAWDAYKVAVQNHWFDNTGYTDGSMPKTGPGGTGYYIDRDQLAQVLENFYATQYPDAFTNVPTTLSVSAKDAAVAQGTADALTVTGKDINGNAVTVDPSNVTYSVYAADSSTDASNGFVNANGVFTATAPGTYGVTATYGTALQASTTIKVAGAAVGYTVSAPSSNVVANGVSETTLTVQAVDANGISTNQYNGTANVTLSGNAVSVTTGTDQASDYSAGKLTFTNGQATLVVTASGNVGLTSTVTVTSNDLKGSNGSYVTANTTLTSVAQVPTSIAVTSANKYVEANLSNPDSFSVEVDDQAGKPMLTGAYAVTLNVNGPAKFADGTTGPDTVVFVGDGNPGNPVDPTVTVNSIAGQTGAIQVIGTATGLTTGQGSAQAVISGPAAQISASLSATSETEGGSGVTLTIGQLDANGYPTASSEANNYTVKVTNASGTDVSSDFSGTGSISNATSTTIAPLTADGALAGTYNVVVSDNNTGGKLTASAPVQLTVTAGTAAKYSFNVGTQQVTEANPTAQVQLSATDLYGNPVSGTVTFAVYANGSLGTATINGQSVNATTPVSVTSNANGVATFNFAAQPYANSTWNLTVGTIKDVNGNTLSLSGGTNQSENVKIESTVATQVSGEVHNDSLTGSPIDSVGQAGNTFHVIINAKDQYGTPMSGDTITVKPSAGLDLSGSGIGSADSNGVYTFTTNSAANLTLNNVVAKGAGVQTLTITDTSAPNSPSTTVSFSITPGTFNGTYALFDSNGNNLSTNSTGAKVSFPNTGSTVVWLKPTDSKGNPVVSTYGDTVDLSSSLNGNGQFRTSLSGANVTSVSVPQGSAGVELYYLNSSSAATTADSNADNLVATAEPIVTGAVYGTVTGNVYGVTLSGANIDSTSSINLSKITVGSSAIGSSAVTGNVLTGTTVKSGDTLNFAAGAVTTAGVSNANAFSVTVK